MGVNINALTDIGTPDNADQLEIFDVSAGVNKKVLRSALSGTTITGSNNQIVYRDGSGNYVTNSTFGYNGTTLAIGGASFNASIRQNLRGIGTTSATFGLVLENSAGTATWGFRDDGVITRAGSYAINVNSDFSLVGTSNTLTAATRLSLLGSSNIVNIFSSTTHGSIIGRSNSVTTTGTGNSVIALGASNTINVSISTRVHAAIGESNTITTAGFAVGQSNNITGDAGRFFYVFGANNTVSGAGSTSQSFTFGESISLTPTSNSKIYAFGRTYTYSLTTGQNMFVFDMKDVSAAANGMFFQPNQDGSTTRGNNLVIGVSPAGVANIGTNNIILRTANAPSATITDTFTLYSADIIAGNAAPHVRTENGAVVKIYQETTAVAAAVFTANAGTAVNDASTFDGYTLRQVVKALRNHGLLQ